MQKKTEDVAACVYLEVIYVSLYLHDLVMILSTKRKKKKNRFIQNPDFYNSFRSWTSVSH